MLRSSFSQHSKFEGCSRQWYLEKVLKMRVPSDMSYAHAGSAIHKVLERWYSGSYNNMQESKDDFSVIWEKYKLHLGKLQTKKDSYWLMCLRGIELNKKIETELKIYFDNCVAYIDGVDKENLELSDWKSSTRTAITDSSYTKQLLLYGWMYKRKYSVIPKKLTIHYLKYSGSKGEMSFSPTEEEMKQTEEWFFDILEKMEETIDKNVLPPMCDKCNFFCPYKDYCASNENRLKYKFTIEGNYLYVNGMMGTLLLKQLNNKFSYELKNSYFIKKNYPMANTIVKFWDEKNRKIPVSMMAAIRKTLNDYAKFVKKEIVIEVVDNRVFNEVQIGDEDGVMMPDKLLIKTLRPYQQEAVDIFLKEKTGMLQIGTGGGKTLISAEIVRKLNVNTLFVVDKKELLNQTYKVFSEELGVPIGRLGGGYEDIQNITIATVQTLNKQLVKYTPLLSKIRFIVWDEAHKIGVDSCVKISNRLVNCEYRLGMSGTVFREDGNEMKMNSVGGYIIHNISSEKLIEDGWLMKPKIVFYKNFQKTPIDEDKLKKGLINETRDYLIYYDTCIVNNKDRNELVKKVVEENKGKKILILTKLIDHGRMLAEMTGGIHLYGGTNKKERLEMFEGFVNGKNNILVSTLSIFSEGIDLPSLSLVVNAGANKGSVKTIQILGRVLRKMDKKIATYIDFIDDVQFFKTASFARKKALRSEGHNVEEIKYEL